jgi:phosphate-selective porin OprO/OprP
LGSLDLEDGVQWRRASISTETTFPRSHLEFKFHYDFAANFPRLKDAYVGLIGLRRDIFQVRAGRYKAPIGLENWTGTGNLTFLERGLISAFISTRNSGIMLHGHLPKGRIRWAFSVLQPEDDFGDPSTDTIGFSSRFTSAFPVKPDVLAHLGIDYFHRNVEDTVRFKERPESHLAPQFVDTGDFPADSVDSIILEGAVVKGPLSFQAEYAYTAVKGDDLPGTVKFNGFYVFGSYFLTGETRHYLQDGRFGAITPLRELRGGSKGYGAFEIAFRASHLDLSDKGVQGGVLNDLTAALNWYPTKHFRAMFNTIRAHRKETGTVWIFQARFQVAF